MNIPALLALAAEARALAQAATPGPWKAHVHHSLHGAPAVDAGRGLFVCACATASDQSGVKDAAFIAAARSMVPQLCDAVVALYEQVNETHAAYEEHLTLAVANLKRAEQAEARVKAVECEARHLERHWKATQEQREKAYERLAQAEAREAGLRDALERIKNEWTSRGTLVFAHIEKALATPSPASRMGERLKAAERCAEMVLAYSTVDMPVQAVDAAHAWHRICSEADRD